MGVQVVGPKKLRLAAQETGLDLDRVVSASNYVWLGRVLTDDGHYHVRIDRRTWEYEVEEEGLTTHWTSCRDLAHNTGSERP